MSPLLTFSMPRVKSSRFSLVMINNWIKWPLQKASSPKWWPPSRWIWTSFWWPRNRPLIRNPLWTSTTSVIHLRMSMPSTHRCFRARLPKWTRISIRWLSRNQWRILLATLAPCQAKSVTLIRTRSLFEWLSSRAKWESIKIKSMRSKIEPPIRKRDRQIPRTNPGGRTTSTLMINKSRLLPSGTTNRNW